MSDENFKTMLLSEVHDAVSAIVSLVAIIEQDEGPGQVAESIQSLADNLKSPNELDGNLETANVVDGLFAISRSIGFFGEQAKRIADSIERAEEHHPIGMAIEHVSDSLDRIASAVDRM